MTGRSIQDIVAENMKDPVYRVEYERQLLEEAVDRVVAELTTARQHSGLTQQALADRLGVGQARVAKIERNHRDPGLGFVIRYAHALGYEIKLEPADRSG